jgi:lysine-N-methylase
MTSAPPALIFANQRYDCQRCGKCCRCFHIAITPLEIEAVAKLQWPVGTQPVNNFYEHFGARSFIRHQPNGDCVYLDANTACRMHNAFGAHCKPLACKAYPFEFLATFDGEVSVMARFDCPAVLAGQGRRLSAHASDIKYILADRQLKLGAGFTVEQLRGLSRIAVETIRDFVAKEITAHSCAPEALAVMLARLEKLGHVFINDIETLRLVLPSMRDKAAFEHKMEPRQQWTWPERVSQRDLLLTYLRRDEALPDFSASTRLHQAWAGLKLYLGGGNAHEFCPSEHPDIAIRKAQLFNERYWSIHPDEENADESFRRFLLARLESLQFFGTANHGCAFFPGLIELLNTVTTARFLARLHAAASSRQCLNAADWQYATAAIDHCFGRRMQV